MSGCLLTGGPTFVIGVGFDRILFEWHDYCGPMPITNKGYGRSLGDRHPFWVAATAWNKQGRKVIDGLCVWEHEP